MQIFVIHAFPQTRSHYEKQSKMIYKEEKNEHSCNQFFKKINLCHR